MAEKISLKSLHLEYRLWIAELNFDITLIRIFNDRLTEIVLADSSIKSAETVKLENKLSGTRKSIDDLTHRMQIEKMNLAASSRETSDPRFKINVPGNYVSIRNDFFNFRISFNELKSEFLKYEGQA
jgi:hypothetical protein